ncbi:MAG TPA: radical SAM protein [Candidatus Deferrimicrobiaceae bacterium]
MSRGDRGRRKAGPAGEIGAVRKEWGGKIRVALIYPNRYAAGMSNLGFLLVHAGINARPDALCERVFLGGPGGRPGVAPPGGRGGISTGGPAGGRTLESGRPLSDFDVVAFSLSYENDLLNVPPILAAGGVPPLREDRSSSGSRHPLVVAGGFAASLNPEPSGSLADAVVVGDGERAVDTLLDLGDFRPADPGFLRDLSRIPGVYVPAGYRPEFRQAPGTPRGFPRLLSLRALTGFPGRVARESLDLRVLPPPPPIALAEETELGSMSLVETSRGCPRMCGFCAASHACPDFREFPLERVRAAVDASWPYRKKVGLIGAAVLDWRPFRALSREILARGGTVSPASVRADLVDPEVAEILSRSGHRTVALAPECGTERQRARVGKWLPDETLFRAAETLVRAGIVSFKLYFLLGVPGVSREEEAGGIASFLAGFRKRVLAAARGVGRMGNITVVLSPFVPKPFTPLQWAPMAPEEELAARGRDVAAAVRGVPNVRLSGDRPAQAVAQGYLGLSDRRVAADLVAARRGRLPGDRPGFEEALSSVVHRERDAEEYFPWDVVDGGPAKPTLRARYEALTGR